MVCLLFFVSAAGADPAKEIPGPVYKEMRPEKTPFDPGKIPTLSFLSRKARTGGHGESQR